jgi:hypothetical protein
VGYLVLYLGRDVEGFLRYARWPARGRANTLQKERFGCPQSGNRQIAIGKVGSQHAWPSIVPPDIFGNSRHSRSRIPPIIPMVIPRPESPLPQPGYVPRVVSNMIEPDTWLRLLNHLQDTPWAAYQVPNSQYPPPVFEARAQGLPVRISFTGNTHESNAYHTQAPVRVPYPSLDQHWTTLVNHCKETDEEMFKNWDEEINALLVFVSRQLPRVTDRCSHHVQAGLFSAVLTAFVVESYQLLQPDNGSTSVLALTAISLQLQALTLGNGSTALPFIQEDPATPISAYVLNALWFIALTASVVSAFFGILLKQVSECALCLFVALIAVTGTPGIQLMERRRRSHRSTRASPAPLLRIFDLEGVRRRGIPACPTRVLSDSVHGRLADLPLWLLVGPWYRAHRHCGCIPSLMRGSHCSSGTHQRLPVQEPGRLGISQARHRMPAAARDLTISEVALSYYSQYRVIQGNSEPGYVADTKLLPVHTS